MSDDSLLPILFEEFCRAVDEYCAVMSAVDDTKAELAATLARVDALRVVLEAYGEPSK